MPLAGGASDKYGGRYEGLWAISRMADVLAERAESIYLEPPGEEGKGVEFRLLADGVREDHQVKRQRGELDFTCAERRGDSGQLFREAERSRGLLRLRIR